MTIRHRVSLKDLPTPVRVALRRFLTNLGSRTGTGWRILWLTRPSRHYRCMIETRGIKVRIRYRAERGRWTWADMALPFGVRRFVTLHTGIDPTAKAREARRLAYERKRQEATTWGQNRECYLDPSVRSEQVNPPTRIHSGFLPRPMVDPGMIDIIKSKFAATSQRTRSDLEELWKQTGGRGRRWDSCTKAAGLLQQARWPAETWIWETLLGELARGEITFATFRKRWAHVISTPSVKRKGPIG